MKFAHATPKALLLASLLVTPAMSVVAQNQTAEEGEVLTTVYAPTPPALDTLAEGPEISGYISAREGNRVQVTSTDGTNTIVVISDETDIRARGGFLGLGRETLSAASLLNGLPVEVKTRQWDGGLVASRVRFSGSDLETAEIVRSGTSQRFAQQDEAIDENRFATEENAAAAAALRSRFAGIDQYNVARTTNVYFDTGRFNLSASARSQLCNAAAEADSMENALLLVVGYTDSTGSQEVNQRLSERRAASVVNHLQQQCGWAPWRMLTPTGLAEADPVADNSTASGKAQNRRVAVNVLVSKSVEGL